MIVFKSPLLTLLLGVVERYGESVREGGPFCSATDEEETRPTMQLAAALFSAAHLHAVERGEGGSFLLDMVAAAEAEIVGSALARDANRPDEVVLSERQRCAEIVESYGEQGGGREPRLRAYLAAAIRSQRDPLT